MSNAHETVVADFEKTAEVDERLRKQLEVDLGLAAKDYVNTLPGDIKQRSRQAASNVHIRKFFSDFMQAKVFDYNAEVTRAN